MRVFLKIGIIFLTLILLFIVGGFFLPSEFDIQRSEIINSSADKVFPQINTLQNWKNWSSWSVNDKTVKFTYNDIKSGKGASMEWTSENSGYGKIIITKSIENQLVGYDIALNEDGEFSQGEIKLNEKNGKTEVIWRFFGEFGANPVYRYFGLFMEDLVGKDFEQSLGRLKEFSEKK